MRQNHNQVAAVQPLTRSTEEKFEGEKTKDESQFEVGEEIERYGHKRKCGLRRKTKGKVRTEDWDGDQILWLWP